MRVRTSNSCLRRRAADDDGKLRHPGRRDGGDHLGAVLGDAARLRLAAHEAEMFCRNISGIPRWSQSSMKCAPLWADSLKSTPLFAMIPTGWPWSLAKPVTSVAPYSPLNSCNALPSTRRAMTSRTS